MRGVSHRKGVKLRPEGERGSEPPPHQLGGLEVVEERCKV